MDLEQMSDLLPPIVLDLIKLIGYQDTAKLISKIGGITFPVSQGMRNKDNFRRDYIVQAVGKDSAEKIERQLGGDVIYIPRCASALREWRNLELVREYRALLATGVSGRRALLKLCPQYGISDRRAQIILARYCDAGKQMGLL
ncbi:Mor transcription activator family protein, partial [Serratia fonticola]